MKPIIISDVAALWLAVLFPSVGIMLELLLRPHFAAKLRTNTPQSPDYAKPATKPKYTISCIHKILPIFICDAYLIISLIIFISYPVCSMNNAHSNQVFVQKQYPIQKLTLDSVYFDDTRTIDLNNTVNVTIEPPDNVHDNIIIKTREDYEIQWLIFQVKTYDTTYHIYLTQELYDRLNDGGTLYVKEDN